MALRLEVGKKYVRNDGAVVDITGFDKSDADLPYRCRDGRWYTESGLYGGQEDNKQYPWHLVREFRDSGHFTTGEYQLRMVVIPFEGDGPVEWTSDMNEATHLALYRATRATGAEEPEHRKTWEWVADFPMRELDRPAWR